MITSDGLEKLGFTPNVDFVLQDDGNGVYIKEWNSASPQPTEAEIETAHAEWQANYEAEQIQAEANKASAISKLEALGLTDAEIKALSGGL